jgi:hypothetical protein
LKLGQAQQKQASLPSFFVVCVKASLPSSQCPTEKKNADLLTERKKEKKTYSVS